MYGYKIPNVYVIGSLILMTAVFSEGLHVVPRNTAVVAGSRTTLNCSRDSSKPNWSRRLSTTVDPITSNSDPFNPSPCIVNPRLNNIYDVSSTSDGSNCNLIINNATSAEALSYSCTDGVVTDSVILLVLDSGPNCSTVNNIEVYPGQVTINCSAQYNSSSGFNLKWSPTNPNCAETFHLNNITPYSTLNCNNSASTPIPSYSCAVVYGSNSVHSNDPSCSTNPVTVFFTQTTAQNPTTAQKPATTVSSIPAVITDTSSTASNVSTAAAIVLGILFAVSLVCNLICIVYIIIMKRNQAAGDKPRIHEAPQNTSTQQEASSTMYTSLELPMFQEGSEIRGRGKQSIYEVPLNKNVEPEASSTMYTTLELPGKQGGASKEGLYENSLKTR